MPFEPLNSENKQHINLSQKASNTLDDDMLLFQFKSKSGFLNRIISNFRETAEASITLSLRRELDRYRDSMKNLDEKTRETIEKILTETFVKKIEDWNKHLDSYKGLKFRINKENADYLFQECQEDLYYDTIGKYLKALIEEYCEKTYLEREQIVYADYFDCISTAIETRRQLKICIKDKEYHHIKPFAITTDPMSMYHYLTGYLSDAVDTDSKSFSYRIANISSIRLLQEKSFISAADQNRLSKEIHENGAQFLQDHTLETIIRFTESGIRKYNRLLHLRPRFKSIDQTGYIYTFCCTQQQIEYYFFKFGADAQILSPQWLRDKFIDMYGEALNDYQHDICKAAET